VSASGQISPTGDVPHDGPGATTDDVAAVIIAGGQASRLGGRVKALIQVDGTSILERQLSLLRAHFSAIAIAANDPLPYRAYGVSVLPDRIPGQGPLAGLSAALAWCPRPYLLAVACDMPYLDQRVLDLLLPRRAPGVDIVAPYIGGRPEPLCALYARSVAPVLEQRLAAGQLRAASLIQHAGLTVARVSEQQWRALDPELRTLTNINTPDDLED
jgi:molybdopterin-guanine dinucleotide biosynthesis protein A